VPLLTWLGPRASAPPLTLLGLGVGLVGCAVLVEGGWSLGPGDWLTAAASVIFAVQMLLLDRLGRRLDPAHFSGAFLGVTGLLGALGAVLLASLGPGLGAWLARVWVMLCEPAVLRDLLSFRDWRPPRNACSSCASFRHCS
jgi:drug/metabolite transporter (DMT)-like permease